jgi:hypothetical protein
MRLQAIDGHSGRPARPGTNLGQARPDRAGLGRARRAAGPCWGRASCLNIGLGTASRADFRAGLAKKHTATNGPGPPKARWMEREGREGWEGRWRPSTCSRLWPEELDVGFGGSVEEGGTLAPRSLTPDLEETWMRPALEAEGAARGQRSHSKSGEDSWAGGGSTATSVCAFARERKGRRCGWGRAVGTWRRHDAELARWGTRRGVTRGWEWASSLWKQLGLRVGPYPPLAN